MRPLSLALGCLALLTACPQVEEPIDCDLMAVSSIQLSVLDELGEPVDGAQAEFSTNGADWTACDDFGDGWVCGYEVGGDIEVRASAPGYDEQQVSVFVDSDVCHVITEQVDLTLEALDCTAEAVAALEVIVSDARGGPVGSEEVVVTRGDADSEDFEPCEAGLDGLHWCGWEWSGEMSVQVSAQGFESQSMDFDVEHDGCHPLTQQWSVDLVPE